MTWKTSDLNVGTELNRSFLERLSAYIEQRESQIALNCLDALGRLAQRTGDARHFSSSVGNMRLSRGMDLFRQKIKEDFSKKGDSLAVSDMNALSADLNSILWGHVEFLEGAITELFSEIERIDLRLWSSSIMEAVREMKQVLSSALDEVEVAINGLNGELTQLHGRTGSRKWLITKMFSGTFLDSELVASIRSSRTSLLNGYEKFMKVFENFSSMKEQITSSIVKIGTLPIFSTLETVEQEQFLELFQLLKCYEKNRKTNVVEEKDLLMSLRKMMSKERAFTVFRDYYHKLYAELFRQSLEIKKNSPLSTSEEARQQTVEYLKDVQSEVVLLGNTIDRYREFLLSTDPNPYVRARLGFAEWVLGPESSESKSLHKFGYNIESLHRLFTQLTESIAAGPDWQMTKEKELHDRIERTLHEMGAPLISEKLVQKGMEQLISSFEEVHELGSFDPQIVPQMGIWLGKALRYDWRYHILHRYPEFHEIYAIHMALANLGEDKLHLARLNKFKKVIAEIRRWVAERETARHSRDIELDINDIRGYLQEFFAHIQRVFAQEGAGKFGEEFALQLLEYRYLFGQFLHRLDKDNTEEYLVLSQFYFVDQYFEAIDKKLAR